MAEKDQFYSFEEALKELRLKEEELKRLVSEGEIRAFREGETMKLRRADVDSLRSELSGGEVVDLGEVREELVFEDEGDAGMATQEIGMVIEDIAEPETIIDEGVEDVGEVELEGAGDAVEGEPASVEVVEEEERTVFSAGPARTPPPPEPYEGGLMRTILLVTSLVLILAIPVCISATSGHFAPVAQTIAGLFPGGK